MTEQRLQIHECMATLLESRRSERCAASRHKAFTNMDTLNPGQCTSLIIGLFLIASQPLFPYATSAGCRAWKTRKQSLLHNSDTFIHSTGHSEASQHEWWWWWRRRIVGSSWVQRRSQRELSWVEFVLGRLAQGWVLVWPAAAGVRSQCPLVGSLPSCSPEPTALCLWLGPRTAEVCPLAPSSGHRKELRVTASLENVISTATLFSSLVHVPNKTFNILHSLFQQPACTLMWLCCLLCCCKDIIHLPFKF